MKMKTLDEYEAIARELYGNESHALKWIHAQRSNKGTLDMSHESMLKLLERMDRKTGEKREAVELPQSVVEVREHVDGQMKSLFSGLRKKS